MSTHQYNADEELARLPIPISSLGIPLKATAAELARFSVNTMNARRTWTSKDRERSITTEFANQAIGDIWLSTGRTAPVCAEYACSPSLSVHICYAGWVGLRDGPNHSTAERGGFLLFPNHGGFVTTGYHSGIAFRIDHAKLARTAEIMMGAGVIDPPDAPMLFSNGCRDRRISRAGSLFSLFQYIDCVLSEGLVETGSLSLDDQIYRTLALAIARAQGKGERESKISWLEERRQLFDDLIDLIRDNVDKPISLTDMQEWSHYSARRLQVLFREKFDCTPMQFVRRQRLAAAMERLQQADWDDTVTKISRACGYRFTSNFSKDFQREFGRTPSMVLRTARVRGKG